MASLIVSKITAFFFRRAIDFCGSNYVDIPSVTGRYDLETHVAAHRRVES